MTKLIKKIFLLLAFCTVSLLSAQESVCIIETKCTHNFNPQVTSYSADAQILTGLYEGLFSYNPITLDPEYAIATDYRISRDKKRITFTIRQNAFFSDGQQITAKHVRNSWLKLLATPDAPYSSLLDIVRGAQAYRTGTGSEENVGIYATDDFHLAVYLNTPANYLPKVLCHSAFSIVSENPEVYSGPFRLKYQDEQSIILEKNEFYWDAANVKLDNIFVEQSIDASENTFRYNAGIASWVDSDFVMDQILDKDAFQMNAEFGTSYYFFKMSSKKPATGIEEFNPWDYEEFRNAVIEVFPWDAFRASSWVPATTLVYPLSGYPTIEGFDYTDVIEAKSKMTLAKRKYNVPLLQRLTLTLEVSEFALGAQLEEVLRKALDEIDVDLVVRRLPTYQYLSNVKVSDADLFSYSWIGDFADPLAFLSLFQTGSTLNDSGWSNDEFDALLEKAASVSDSERYQLLSQAEVILLDSGVILPIYHPVAFNLVDTKELGGWSTNAFNVHPLKYLYKKDTKATVPNIVMR